jgi:hypothetical protein
MKGSITLKYKFRIVFDNNNIIYFEEWAPAVVCFFNCINSYLNDLIEIYENDSVVLIWVKGKGVISKKSAPVRRLNLEVPVRLGKPATITID